MKFVKNKDLAGLLMSCPGLLLVTVKHNLVFKTSGHLHKNKDRGKNSGIFLKYTRK